MKKVCFRFDIDTHKCIRDGVPNLLRLSEGYKVPFTFFLNMGRAVSIKDSLLSNKAADDEIEHCKSLTAYEKLGTLDCLVAAIINPRNAWYTKQIKNLVSNPYCEVGIHGGRNHATWQFHANEWPEDKLRGEIEWAIDRIRKIAQEYELGGFAAPTFNHPESLSRVLSELGFKFSADFHGVEQHIISQKDGLTDVGINLLGEPGGVAFWESCLAKGMNLDQISDEFKRAIDKNDIIVVYDHPYLAGCRCLDSISRIIEYLQDEQIELATLSSILN